MSKLLRMPCVDSDELAATRRRELHIETERAVELAQSVIEAVRRGEYRTASGKVVRWREAVRAARRGKRSIPPDETLTEPDPAVNFPETRVLVSQETTLGAARRLVESGHRPLALNFANGVNPGGGFLFGARAQEEALCRCSALYPTLLGDPMYEAHQERPTLDSTDWAIYSPDVPVFRSDDGVELDEPWLLCFLTCAAPYRPDVGQPLAGDLLKQRILRVLAIARSLGHTSLVLGAWGCGAFENDPVRTAEDFRRALEGPFAGAFSEVVFAITDSSPERRTLGPFRRVLSS